MNLSADKVYKLDEFLPLLNLERVSQSTQVDAAVVASDFATDAACAELVGDRGVGLEFELYAAALAASFQIPAVPLAHVPRVSGGLWVSLTWAY